MRRVDGTFPARPAGSGRRHANRTIGTYYLSDEDTIMVEAIDPFGKVDFLPFDALEWLDDLLDELF